MIEFTVIKISGSCSFSNISWKWNIRQCAGPQRRCDRLMRHSVDRFLDPYPYRGRPPGLRSRAMQDGSYRWHKSNAN